MKKAWLPTESQGMDQLEDSTLSSCSALDKHPPSSTQAFSITMPTSSYLPDLLPLQEHDLLHQASSSHQHHHHHEVFQTAMPTSTHQDILSNVGQLGHHPMLEGLQPIRKEEIVRLRNDGGEYISIK